MRAVRIPIILGLVLCSAVLSSQSAFAQWGGFGGFGGGGFGGGSFGGTGFGGGGFGAAPAPSFGNVAPVPTGPSPSYGGGYNAYLGGNNSGGDCAAFFISVHHQLAGPIRGERPACSGV